MSTFDTIKEIGSYFSAHKRRWMLPIVIFLVIFGVLLVASSQSVFAPLIYTLF
ncbi:MAG: DUF5989 family protein [bacterium]|nr:DUF5989 family protein [bacterium]MDZ4296567.1 DUF5989 family protein [Patescibacteria group bacterium]